MLRLAAGVCRAAGWWAAATASKSALPITSCPFPPPCSFPYLSVAVLLPCALLAAAGVQVLLSASVLVAWELCDSLNLIWTQVGVRPCPRVRWGGQQRG